MIITSQKPDYFGRLVQGNTLSHLKIQERDELRTLLLSILTFYESIKVIAGIIHLPTIYNHYKIETPESIYALAYTTLIDAYQRRLSELSQTIGSTVNGIIVSDHRNSSQDLTLRKLHMEILKSENPEEPKYPNLIESLFLAPSHHSIGIQFADLISGATFRYFEQNDNKWYQLVEPILWKSPTGKVEDYGLIKMPEPTKEKDAESSKPLSYPEPAVMTQSQRTSDRT